MPALGAAASFFAARRLEKIENPLKRCFTAYLSSSRMVGIRYASERLNR
jgi:hypothetical protein